MDNPPCVFLSPPWTPDCAPQARRGARGTCSLAAKLPPLGNRPRGSQAWQGDALHPSLRGFAAQGRRGTCGLAGVLPPLGDRPHGSQVWSGSLYPSRTDRRGTCRATARARLRENAGTRKGSGQLRGSRTPIRDAAKSPSHGHYFNLQGVRLPAANCGGAKRR